MTQRKNDSIQPKPRQKKAEEVIEESGLIEEKENPDLQGELITSILNFASDRNFEHQNLDNSVGLVNGGNTDSFYGFEKFDRKGIEIYQRNLVASACRALAISYPTVELLVGTDFFQHLCQKFLEDYPKQQFDWAQWGEEFPSWLATKNTVDDVPYLADCASLDWQIHTTHAVIVPEVDIDSLSLLQGQPLEQLNLHLDPTVRFVDSEFPIVDIYCAHQKDPNNPNLHKAYENLTNGVGQSAMVYRKAWQSSVVSVDTKERYWVDGCLRSASIGSLLENKPPSVMAFEQWLPSTIERELFSKITFTEQTSEI